MDAPVLRPMSTGEILDTAFGIYRSRYATLLTVALTCQALPLVLSIYLVQAGGGKPTGPFILGQGGDVLLSHLALWVAASFVSALMRALAVAATTTIVAGAYIGEPRSAGAALQATLPLIPRLVVVSFFTGLAIIIGFLALIIPGVVLLAGLVLASAVVVLEQPIRGTKAMQRSWDLTQGFRGKVLITVLVPSFLLTTPAFLVNTIGVVASRSGSWSPLISPLLASVLQIFVFPFMYVVITVLYYDLRVRKEGFDLELLATAARPDE